MPPAHMRVIATPNGGGFGGKSDPFNHEMVVAELARCTGRPVKICLTREEVFFCHRGRHPVLMRVRTGVKNDGRIVAMDFATLLDGGAYGSYGVASTFYTGALQTVTYEIPAYRFRGLRAFTNKPPCGPKRGHGTPQPRFGQEVQLDKIAEHLQLDPADMRRKILQPANSVTANWLRVGSIGLGPRHRRRSEARAAGATNSANSPSAAASASPARATSPARTCRSTGTSCRTRACSSSSTAPAASPRSAAARRSARARTRCSRCSSPRCSASKSSTSASSPATPISRRSISAPTPRASRS